MASKSNSKAVATVEQSANLPAAGDNYDYGDFGNMGFDNHTSDDYSIPFIGLLQSNSPECSDDESEARPGMIINRATGDVYSGKDGFVFVPSRTERKFVEWVPRDSGGGLAGVHEADSEIVLEATANQKFGKLKLANGNDLMETFYAYGMAVLPDGTEMQAVIDFSSTKIKNYKNWMTKARTVQYVNPKTGKRSNLPLMAHRYRIKTEKTKNNKGEFFIYAITFDGANAVEARIAPNSDLFLAAVALNDAVSSGTAKADMNKTDRGGAVSDEGGAPADDGSGIPF